MNSGENSKVYVLLDRPRHHADSLTSAASLAKQMKIPLQGLFIEDNALLCAAELPFTQEISIWSAQERNMTTATTERIFRTFARQIKKEVENAAETEHIDWAFQTIRSERLNWILESRTSADILFIGGEEYGSRNFKRINQRSLKSKTVKVLYTGSKRSEKALEAAQRIAKKTYLPLEIFSTVTQQIKSTATTTRVPDDIPLLQAALSKQRAYMLVLPGDAEIINDEQKLKQLLQLTQTPVVIV